MREGCIGRFGQTPASRVKGARWTILQDGGARLKYDNPMFFPLFAMVVLTALVFSLNLGLRVWSVATRRVSAKHFKLVNTTEQVPEFLQAGTRHMANLFETPVLFYVGGVLTVVMHAETRVVIAIAWGYVGLRALHALIHMTYNNVLHRMFAFLASFVAVMCLWAHLLIAQLHN
jgi:hypothetical protein